MLEKNILGSIISVYEDLGSISNILTQYMFENPVHRAIYSVCLKLYDQGKRIDLLTVDAELKGKSIYMKAGGASYLAEMSQITCGRLAEHALMLKEIYIKSVVHEMAKGIIIALVEQKPLDDILGILNTVIDQVHSLLVEKNKSLPVSIAMMKCLDELESWIAKKQNGDMIGIPTGLTKLDELTNGWKESQLIVLAARPGQGKTQLAIHFAFTAASYNYACLIFSLEMTTSALMHRTVIAQSGLSSKDYRSGKLSQKSWEMVTNIGSRIQQMPITINDTPLQTVRKIRTECLLQKKRGSLDLVIIDYLQLLEPEDRRQVREQQVATITRGLKLLAKELAIPVILLCQLNRDAENNTEKRPSLANLRESGAIEQDADLVMLLLRPEIYGKKTVTIGEQENVSTAGLGLIYVAKQRDGAIGDILFKYNEQFSEIKDYKP